MKLYVTTESKVDALWTLEQDRLRTQWEGRGLDTHDVDAILTEVDTTALYDAFRGARGEPSKTYDILMAYQQALQDIATAAGL